MKIKVQPKLIFTRIELYSGICEKYSRIEGRKNGNVFVVLQGTAEFKTALKWLPPNLKPLLLQTLKEEGGVLWERDQKIEAVWCGVDCTHNPVCNTFKCPLPFAIQGSTAFRSRVQAQAIATTLTDSCYARSPCLNKCKRYLQTGLVDPVAQARARAIVGSRR